jgi:Squalene-hopene cyclase C-terminal domain
VTQVLLRGGVLVLAALIFVSGSPRPLQAADAGADAKEIQAVVEKAYAYLKTSQGEDGSWSPKVAGPGVTALVVAGLLRNGYGSDDPVVAKAIAYLEKKVKADGGVYDKGLATYVTSVSLMAFQEANKDNKYTTLLKNGAKFLKTLQYGEGDSVKTGGLGYGDKNSAKNRPDLSNTQFFLDAMLAAGVSKDDPAVKDALKFVSRCQNLPGETNDQPFAKKTTKDDEGGLVYTPLDADDPKHQTPDGGLRSLGAMTYGGLKSFLYAGVDRKDPRVQGAIGWIKRHYTLDENPGLGKKGLFYYYHTFGKALTALGDDAFVDAKDVKHDWRKELFEAVRTRQKENGSFVNAGDMAFGEADPNLATAFAVLTLSYTKK